MTHSYTAWHAVARLVSDIALITRTLRMARLSRGIVRGALKPAFGQVVSGHPNGVRSDQTIQRGEVLSKYRAATYGMDDALSFQKQKRGVTGKLRLRG